MKNKTFIHIGFPKTGTTYLQNNIFNKISIYYLGKPWDGKIEKLRIIDKNLSLLEDKDFKKIKKNYIKLISNMYNGKNLISNEDCLRVSRYAPQKKNNIFKNLKRYYELLSPNSEVYYILIIRNHKDLLYSYFNEYGYTLQERFKINKKNLIKILKRKQKNLIFDSFKYYKIYNYLIKMVGQKRVKVLFYEDLKYNSNFFFKDLFQFMKVKKKKYKIDYSYNRTIDKFSPIYVKLFKLFKKDFVFKLFNIKNYILYINFFFKILFEKNIFYEYPYFEKNKSIISNFYKKDLLKFNKKYQSKFLKYKYY